MQDAGRDDDRRGGLSRLRDVGLDAAADSGDAGVARCEELRDPEHAVLLGHAHHLPVEVEVLGEGPDQSEHRDGDPSLSHAWATGAEVQTSRGLVVGTASGPGTADRALQAYRKHYTGKSEDIEKAHAVVWATDPWRSACERTDYAPGDLSKFWPGLIEPQGRVHFVGAYADNLNWGQEAATRSANRVAAAIDAL